MTEKEQANAIAWDEYGIELEAVLTYLDALRASGATNMFGAGEYLEEEFGFEK